MTNPVSDARHALSCSRDEAAREWAEYERLMRAAQQALDRWIDAHNRARACQRKLRELGVEA